jgi:aspartate kinase
MTCDPRLIPSARVIERISYVEAAELAWFGAKVLHPRTIAPAVAQKIAVRVLNTHNVSSPGTLITEAGDETEAAGPRAVAVKRGITVVHMTSNKMLGAHGFLARLFAIFEELELSVDLITTSEVSVSVTIDEERPELIERLKPVADVQVIGNQCIVAVVGRNLMRDSIVGARIFEAMRGIPMSMFSLGTSGLNLSIVVDEREADRAVRAVHAALFEAPVEGASCSAPLTRRFAAPSTRCAERGITQRDPSPRVSGEKVAEGRMRGVVRSISRDALESDRVS